jgi:hypothetical protein
VHQTVARPFSAPLLEDERIELVCAEGRNQLMRTEERFDVIQLTGIDTWTALNSGAYVLAENYLYTVEACRTMIERLEDDGSLQITRMAAGMETIRLLNNLLHGLPEELRGNFANMVAAFRAPNDYLICVALKKDGYSPEEAQQLRQFVTEAGIGTVYMPDAEGQAQVGRVGKQLEEAFAEIQRLQGEIEQRTAGVDDDRIQELTEQKRAIESSLHNLEVDHDVGRFVLAADKDQFVRSYPFDVSPTTDDRPYFFSFLRWDNPEKAQEMFHKPTWVVQGNPLFLRNQLILSSLAALLFILLPLLFRGGASGGGQRTGGLRFLAYFAGLGVGFIGIEVSLIQKFTLLLGLPLYSIVVTLCAILICTGIGSFLSRSVLTPIERGRFVPLGILIMVLLIAVVSPWVVGWCIGLPLWARAAVVVLMIAPLGVLLGMPFAHGIRVVERTNPSFVPWAWAVNGCTTVVGSILTVILSMRFGFAIVLVFSGLVYLLAFAAIDSLARNDLFTDDQADDDEDFLADNEAPADGEAVEPAGGI